MRPYWKRFDLPFRLVEAVLHERKTVSACSMVSAVIVRYIYVTALFDLYPFLLKLFHFMWVKAFLHKLVRFPYRLVQWSTAAIAIIGRKRSLIMRQQWSSEWQHHRSAVNLTSIDGNKNLLRLSGLNIWMNRWEPVTWWRKPFDISDQDRTSIDRLMRQRRCRYDAVLFAGGIAVQLPAKTSELSSTIRIWSSCQNSYVCMSLLDICNVRIQWRILHSSGEEQSAIRVTNSNRTVTSSLRRGQLSSSFHPPMSIFFFLSRSMLASISTSRTVIHSVFLSVGEADWRVHASSNLFSSLLSSQLRWLTDWRDMLDDNCDWHEIDLIFLNLASQKSLVKNNLENNLENNLVRKHCRTPMDKLSAQQIHALFSL